MGVELHKDGFHWSGRPLYFTKKHGCDVYGDEIVFDERSGKWLIAGEYLTEINYCPMCGERLQWV